MVAIYVYEDEYTASLIWEGDFERFRDEIYEYNGDWKTYDLPTSSEANGFIAGLTRNEDERSPARYAILRSDNPEHEPYFEFLKEYI